MSGRNLHTAPDSVRTAAVVALSLLLICAFVSPVGAWGAGPDSIGTGAGPGGPTLASFAAGATPLSGSSTPAAGGVLFKLVLALALVLGLILLLQKAARRWGGSFQGGAGPDVIRIISSRSVGPRMSLALVQVMNRNLLVGISPQGIRHVADLGDAEGFSTAAPITAAQRRSAPAEGGIWGRLTGMLSRDRIAAGAAPRQTAVAHRSGQGPTGGSADSSAGFEGELSRRLNELRRSYATLSEMESGLEGGRP